MNIENNINLTSASINNINDKNEVLNVLSGFSDEDFNGNNGIEFTSHKAIEKGFNSTQDYVLDFLKNSNLTGEELINKYFSLWLDNDNYYQGYIYNLLPVNSKYVLSVVIIKADN